MLLRSCQRSTTDLEVASLVATAIEPCLIMRVYDMQERWHTQTPWWNSTSGRTGIATTLLWACLLRGCGRFRPNVLCPESCPEALPPRLCPCPSLGQPSCWDHGAIEVCTSEPDSLREGEQNQPLLVRLPGFTCPFTDVGHWAGSAC